MHSKDSDKRLHFRNVSLEEIESFQLADYLSDTTCSTADWKFRPALNALTWVERTVGLKQFIPSLQVVLIQSFFHSKKKPPTNPSVIPVKLGMAHVLEKSKLESESTVCILPLGVFLLMSWASLRFGDVQRIRLSDISIVRRVAWTNMAE